MLPIQQFSHAFSSAEEFSAVVGSTAWELDFRQLSRGQGTLPARLIQGASCQWLNVQTSALIHQRALPPQGHVTIGITNNPEAEARFGAHDVQWNELCLFDPVAGLDCISTEGFGAYTLSFPEQHLRKIATNLALPCPGDTPAKVAFQSTRPKDIARLRALLAEFDKVMFTGNDIQRSNALADAESDLPVLLLQTWGGGEQTTPAAGNNRRRALNRALDYIEAHPHAVIGVEQLCEAAACSISTLERAFGEHLGISPKRYLVAIRLSAVRRQLLDPGQAQTIGDIAADWGFWHMSKFAQDYRRMFGEKPSDTRSNAGLTRLRAAAP